MTDYRGEHRDAVYQAIDSIGELQGILANATEHCDVATGAVLAATGGADLESANNAVEFLRLAKESIQEAYRQCGVASDEARRYGDGF